MTALVNWNLPPSDASRRFEAHGCVATIRVRDVYVRCCLDGFSILVARPTRICSKALATCWMANGAAKVGRGCGRQRGRSDMPTSHRTAPPDRLGGGYLGSDVPGGSWARSASWPLGTRR